MGIHDFKYPIFPDRTYTIRGNGMDRQVSGAILIEAYLLYEESLIPSQTPDTDIEESPL